MDEKSTFRPAGYAPRREALTGAYLLAMLLVFPLFTGLEGYTNITRSKYLFFLTCTALWLSGLALLSLSREKGGRTLGRFGLPDCCAAGFALVCCLSWLCSPWRAESLLGGGRYDGLVTLLALCGVYLGLRRFGHYRALYSAALAVSSTVCCAVAMLQLLGFNPLWLFPGDLRYADAGVRYSSRFLGTIGNTDMLSAFLCLSVPLFWGLLTVLPERRGRFYALPLFAGVTVLSAAGVSGGLLALGLTGLLSPALLCTSSSRLRHWLIAAGLCFAAAGCGFAFPGSAAAAPRAAFPVCLALAALCLVLSSALGAAPLQLPGYVFRRFFLLAAVLVLIFGAFLLWFWPGGKGSTAWEFSQVLHGRVEDRFGSSRIRIWRAVLSLVRERPVLGGGPGTVALRVDIVFSRNVAETGKTLRTFVDNAHNEYLQLLADTGAAGLGFYLLLLGSAASACPPSRRFLLLPVLCYCVQDFFGLGLCLVSPVFWILLAML